MAEVMVKVSSVMLTNDSGREIPGIEVTCPRCGHTVECFGRSDRSVKRSCILLKEECPRGETNWYTTPELEAARGEAEAVDRGTDWQPPDAPGGPTGPAFDPFDTI